MQRSQYYQYFEIIDQIFFEQFPFTTFPCSLPQFLPDRSDGICLSSKYRLFDILQSMSANRLFNTLLPKKGSVLLYPS